MCKAPVQEHVSQELVDMEVAGQKKMKTEHRVEVNAATLEHPRRQKRQYVYDEQVLRYGWYVVHLAYLRFADLLLTKNLLR